MVILLLPKNLPPFDPIRYSKNFTPFRSDLVRYSWNFTPSLYDLAGMVNILPPADMNWYDMALIFFVPTPVSNDCKQRSAQTDRDPIGFRSDPDPIFSKGDRSDPEKNFQMCRPLTARSNKLFLKTLCRIFFWIE